MKRERDGYEWKGRKKRKKWVGLSGGGGHYDLVFDSVDKLCAEGNGFSFSFSFSSSSLQLR